MSEPVQRYKLLQDAGLKHGFILRIPGVDVLAERELVLDRLKSSHDAILAQEGIHGMARAEQVHGGHVAVVEKAEMVALCDGLVTTQQGLALGIYVADCCAVYAVDMVRGVIGLSHSGKKGTDNNISGAMLQTMQRLGADLSETRVVLSPCIRPPDYEVDFAATIRRQCVESGVRPENIQDDGDNTASDLPRYYSYRIEKGKTGRMLAYLMLS